jgi:hypothetical protein
MTGPQHGQLSEFPAAAAANMKLNVRTCSVRKRPFTKELRVSIPVEVLTNSKPRKLGICGSSTFKLSLD